MMHPMQGTLPRNTTIRNRLLLLLLALLLCLTPTPAYTSVIVASFTATAEDGLVVLDWETATEINLLGFHLYRADAPDSERIRLNDALIPSQNLGGLVGATYTFLDEMVVPGPTYYYWLEDVDVYGVATLHGPVSATVPESPVHAIYLPIVSKSMEP